MISKRVQIFGKVQGVFFRVSTKEKADSLGLNGWVRNELNGSVVIEVTGKKEAIQKLEDWCHEGSPTSTVHTVESNIIPLKKHHGFLITS